MALRDVSSISDHIKSWTIVEKDILRAGEFCYELIGNAEECEGRRIEEGTLLLCLRAPYGEEDPAVETIEVLHPEFGPIELKLGSAVPHTRTPMLFRSAREFFFYAVCCVVTVAAGLTLMTLKARREAVDASVEGLKTLIWMMRRKLLRPS